MPVNPDTTERIITPMPKELVAAVDEYRFANRIASRAEAIRQLLRLGLDSANKRLFHFP